MPSELEETLEFQIKLLKLHEGMEREARFHKSRMWRFDFSWPEKKIAAECEGGSWNRGAHVRPLKFTQDCIKYNTATLEGWKVFRFTSDMIKSGEAINTIERALAT